ncbi:hypothetical protein ACFIJ5_15915 [Haloimpatiens sp. FM7330]|uniref:hypothetical protein n=1 Tax=Haloimpatiens sp. FM7330 TaxID=3298610 RepID=UPI0036432202
MSFFTRNDLYRVEINEVCYVPATMLGGRAGTYPTLESIEKKGNYGSIPVGTKGWIVEKFGKKYFRPDEDQEGIDLFTPANQPIVLVPYKVVDGHYKKI